jgi:thioredoxin 2
MTTKPADAALIRCGSCEAINRVPVKRLKENPICGKCKRLLDFPMGPVAAAGDLETEFLLWPETVLVEFTGRDCAPCRSVAPAVEDIAFLRAGRLKVLRIDITAQPALTAAHSVRTTPTFLLFRNSTQIARLDGVPRDKSELLDWIEQHLSS